MDEARIVSNPSVMMGKPVVKGTRITVELILEELAAGEAFAQIIDAHPQLTEADIGAAVDKADVVSAAVRQPAEEIEGAFAVISPKTIRIRKV